MAPVRRAYPWRGHHTAGIYSEGPPHYIKKTRSEALFPPPRPRAGFSGGDSSKDSDRPQTRTHKGSVGWRVGRTDGAVQEPTSDLRRYLAGELRRITLPRPPLNRLQARPRRGRIGYAFFIRLYPTDATHICGLAARGYHAPPPPPPSPLPPPPLKLPPPPLKLPPPLPESDLE